MKKNDIGLFMVFFIIILFATSTLHFADDNNIVGRAIIFSICAIAIVTYLAIKYIKNRDCVSKSKMVLYILIDIVSLVTCVMFLAYINLYKIEGGISNLLYLLSGLFILPVGYTIIKIMKAKESKDFYVEE